MESEERRGFDDAPGASSATGSFECNICLDVARDAVVSLCGHLFCWPCIHQWLETRPNRQTCPVCKAAITRDKLIPLYGRGANDKADPRDQVPPRPQGQRTEPPPERGFGHNMFGGWGFPGQYEAAAAGGAQGGGFHMTFGVGAFPFGFFASNFNFGGGQNGPNAEEHELVSKMFLVIAFIFIFWMILV